MEELRRFEALSHLSDAQLGQLGSCIAERTLPYGTTLFRHGNEGSEIVLVAGGEVGVRRATPYGDFELAAIRCGGMVGEISYIDRRGRTNDVETLSESRLLVIDPEALHAIAVTDAAFEQAIYWAFWKSLSEKLRGANQRILDFFQIEPGATSEREDVLRFPTDSYELDLSAKRDVFEEQRLSAMEINFLASLSREERFEPGQVIFRQGDAGDRLYVVVEGRVMISTEIPGAGEEALSFLGRGDFFGEMALIDNAPRSATAKSHPESGTLVLGVPRDVVEGILDVHGISSIRLLKTLCSMLAKRLRRIDEKLVGWFVVAAADPEIRNALGSS